MALAFASALGLMAAGANAQAISNATFNVGGPGQGYLSGDLILTFYDVNGTESADLGFDLGKASQFTGLTGASYTVTAFDTPAGSPAADLAAAGLSPGPDTFWTISGGNTVTNEIWVTGTSPSDVLDATGNQVQLASIFDQDIGSSVSNGAGFNVTGTFDAQLATKNAFVDIGAGNWSGAYDTPVSTEASGVSTLDLWDLAQTAGGPKAGIDLGSFTLNASTDTLTFTPDATEQPVTGGSARLINISTRAQVGTGGNVLIPGFVIEGAGTETLLVRADGPSLSTFGVTGVLEQPSLTVFNSSGVAIASNTGWASSANPSQIAATAASVGAFPLAAGSADSALLISLPAGAYTVQVSGVNDTTGVALAEIYEVSSTGTRLVNISSRAQVGTGGNIIISGFVISGNGNENVLVRGDGPSLAQFGVTGILAQPSLSVIDNTRAVVASNTGWGTSSNPSQIENTTALVGTFPFVAGSADSAQVVSLPPGAYTVQISGASGSTGVALAEVFEIPTPQ